MLSEINQTEKDKYCMIYVESRRAKLIKTEGKMVKKLISGEVKETASSYLVVIITPQRTSNGAGRHRVKATAPQTIAEFGFLDLNVAHGIATNKKQLQHKRNFYLASRRRP